jgi:hypothetical protein
MTFFVSALFDLRDSRSASLISTFYSIWYLQPPISNRTKSIADELLLDPEVRRHVLSYLSLQPIPTTAPNPFPPPELSATPAALP